MSEESSPLRLRPKLGGESPATAAVAPSASAAAAPPVVPVLNPPAPAAPSAPPDFPARAQKVQRAALLILAAGVIVFAAVAYVAFPRIRAMEKEFLADQSASAADDEKELPQPAPRTPSQAAAPTPPPSDSTAATASPSPAPTIPAARATPPAATATTAPATPDATGPSVAFRAWVQEVKITGVRTGDHPRILLGRSSFNIGDVVHPELGIVFDGYDPARRMLRFKDATGATLERRHP